MVTDLLHLQNHLPWIPFRSIKVYLLLQVLLVPPLRTGPPASSFHLCIYRRGSAIDRALQGWLLQRIAHPARKLARLNPGWWCASGYVYFLLDPGPLISCCLPCSRINHLDENDLNQPLNALAFLCHQSWPLLQSKHLGYLLQSKSKQQLTLTVSFSNSFIFSLPNSSSRRPGTSGWSRS